MPKSSEFYGIPHPITFIVDEKGVIQSRISEEDFRRRFTVGNLIGRKADVKDVPAKRVKITQSSATPLFMAGSDLNCVSKFNSRPRVTCMRQAYRVISLSNGSSSERFLRRDPYPISGAAKPFPETYKRNCPCVRR